MQIPGARVPDVEHHLSFFWIEYLATEISLPVVSCHAEGRFFFVRLCLCLSSCPTHLSVVLLSFVVEELAVHPVFIFFSEGNYLYVVLD